MGAAVGHHHGLLLPILMLLSAQDNDTLLRPITGLGMRLPALSQHSRIWLIAHVTPLTRLDLCRATLCRSCQSSWVWRLA